MVMVGWPVSVPRSEADPDVVILPDFVVGSSRREFDRLGKAVKAEVEQEKSAQKQQAILNKLGIGVHGFSTKHISAGIVTVFYIPIFAGFGISW